MQRHKNFCASVLLWQASQNLLTFCFTKMYFYCIQINKNEKDNTGFNYGYIFFCSLQQ